MSSITIYPRDYCVVDKDNPNRTGYADSQVSGNEVLLMHFDLPQVLKGKTVTGIDYHIKVLGINAPNGSLPSGRIYVGELDSLFEVSTITYGKLPHLYESASLLVHSAGDATLPDTSVTQYDIQDIFDFGIYANQEWLQGPIIATPASNGFYAVVYYEAASTSISYAAMPYIDPMQELGLSWTLKDGYLPRAQTAAVVTYQLPDGTAKTINISGTANTASIPANTFPVGNSSYKVDVTLEDGQTVSGDWQAITVSQAQAVNLSPVSGYVRNEAAAVFSWDVTRRIDRSYVSIPISSGSLQWRDGSSGAVNAIDTGSARTLTIGANVLPNTAELQWRLTDVKTSAGDNITSEWYTVTTLESLSTAVPIYPVDSTVDGAKPAVFAWSHIISTGTRPTGFEIETSPDKAVWTQLVLNTESEATSYAVAADSLSAGTLYWRVRTYNSDGAAGSWSDAAEITVIASPAKPSISIVSQEPRFALRWSGQGQQAYELMIDGKLCAYKFGTEGNYSHDDYLSDGTHTVAVRIQNDLGLWSEWDSIALQISNRPGADIGLVVSNLGTSIILGWGDSAEYMEYWIYRNGKCIGKTHDLRYTDHYCVGHCVYHVLGVIIGSGNFGKSNSSEADVQLQGIVLTDTATLETVVLRYTEAQNRTISRRWQRETKYTHYAGQELPEAEYGDAVDRYYDIMCAFTPSMASDIAKFEAMFGHTVCVRDMTGTKLFGALENVNSKDNLYYKTYAATVRSVAFREG